MPPFLFKDPEYTYFYARYAFCNKTKALVILGKSLIFRFRLT
jgi:hypothetical protein